MNNIYNSSKRKDTQKDFRKLNLINSFIFSASTEKPENAKFIAKLIIERATGKKVGEISVTQEKTLLGIDMGSHGIRMDLYIEEYEKERIAKVYDIEPNTYKTTELPMRSRYSQALTDVKLLETGKKYKTLPEYMSIWILPFDPFGENRMLYTVKNCVEENTQIEYNDGVTKLFLYVGGELGGSENLKKLLNYMSKSEKENVTDPELLQLHNIVEEVRDDWKVGEQYMTLQEYLEYEIEEGVEAGIQARVDAAVKEAVDAAMKEAVDAAVKEAVDTAVKEAVDTKTQETVEMVVEMLRELNISDERIAEKLIEKYQLSVEEVKSYLNK